SVAVDRALDGHLQARVLGGRAGQGVATGDGARLLAGDPQGEELSGRVPEVLLGPLGDVEDDRFGVRGLLDHLGDRELAYEGAQLGGIGHEGKPNSWAGRSGGVLTPGGRAG